MDATNSGTSRSGFLSLVTSLIEIQCELPFKIADGVTIERPTADVRDSLKAHLIAAVGDSAWQVNRWFEEHWMPVEGREGSLRPEPLPEEQWRYYVVCTEDNGTTAINLHRASEVTDTPLDLVSVMQSRDGTARHTSPGKLLWRFFGLNERPRVIGEADLLELRSTFDAYTSVVGPRFDQPKHPEIARAHDLLDSLGGFKTEAQHTGY